MFRKFLILCVGIAIGLTLYLWAREALPQSCVSKGCGSIKRDLTGLQSFRTSFATILTPPPSFVEESRYLPIPEEDVRHGIRVTLTSRVMPGMIPPLGHRVPIEWTKSRRVYEWSIECDGSREGLHAARVINLELYDIHTGEFSNVQKRQPQYRPPTRPKEEKKEADDS